MIKLWISAESDREVSRRLMSIAREVERIFNDAQIDCPTIGDDFEIRYVPIAKGGFSSSFPSETKLCSEENALDLNPILRHETFYSGTADEAIREFCRGLKLARTLLSEEYRPEFDSRISYVEKKLGA